MNKEPRDTVIFFIISFLCMAGIVFYLNNALLCKDEVSADEINITALDPNIGIDGFLSSDFKDCPNAWPDGWDDVMEYYYYERIIDLKNH